MRQTSTKKKSAGKPVEIETKLKPEGISEKNQKQLQNIFQHAPAAIAVYEGSEYKYILANKAYEKLTNRKAADLLGKSFHEVFPELTGTGAFELFDNIFKNEESFTAPEYAAMVDIKNDGVLKQCYFNFSMESLKNDLGEIYAIISMSYDITEQVEARKKIEESDKALRASQEALKRNEKQLQNIFNTTTVAIGVLEGPEYKYSLVNPVTCQITNRTKEELLGKTVKQVFPEVEAQGIFKLYDEVYNTGIPFAINELPMQMDLLRDGIVRPYFLDLSCNALRNSDDQIYALLLTAVNVTYQVEARNKIEESEKQQAFLLELSDTIRMLDNPVDIEEAVTKFTREFMDADWCFYRTIEEDNAIILRDAMREDLSSVAGVYSLSSFTLLKAAFDKGCPFIVDDVHTTDILDEELKQLCIQLQNISFINVPVIKNGKPVGALCLVQSKPRKWTDAEVQLSVETAERTWAAVKRAKAEEALHKSEEKYRTLFTSIDQGFALCELVRNKEGKGIDYYVLEVNPTYEKQSGVSIEMVRGKTILQAFPTVDKQHIYTYAAVVDNQCPVVFEQYFEVNHRWHELKVYPGKKDKFIVLFNDITERKLFEKELMEAKVFAENAVKSKQQFLSNMSHEIRTPLNSIIGFANVLLKNELSVRQKEYLQAIKTSSKSLNLLIDDILDLAKVDAGKMTFEKQPFDIHKSIISILHSFDLKIKEKNLKLIKEYDSKIPSILLGDSLRLNQIFLNLLSNAVKFTHKGKITLSVKLLSETEENVTLEFAVTDTGIGIADNKLNSIFNLFEQAELSTSHAYGGTGLGLAIVKQLIEAQGGLITLRSKLGEGSTFSFILPFGKTNIKLEEEMEIVKPDSEIKNLRVLVAEDVILNQLLIKIILSDFGFEYEIVGTGKMAIEKMQTHTYDIILMDLQMPEMNGFEATEYIRKTLKSQIPIIALTADVTTADVTKCKEFGMDDYISKPINENLLYSKMMKLVKKKL